MRSAVAASRAAPDPWRRSTLRARTAADCAGVRPLQFALITFTSPSSCLPIAVIPRTFYHATRDARPARRTARARAFSAASCAPSPPRPGIFRISSHHPAGFRIAGGLILCPRDCHAARPAHDAGSSPEISGGRKGDVAITPLAVPLLAGPGSISTVMFSAAQPSRRCRRPASTAPKTSARRSRA